ncbi:MAG: hypothetical protein JSV17_01665 [Candidatus Aminicenantes bacterium]|nr:MAG: hypothetical protein JSV17_01665 [Candidatus Aminicenantes bacterium]
MKKVVLWIVAFLITASTAVYQRMTGPTYPIGGKTKIGNNEIRFELLRTYETGKDCPIQIEVQSPEISGTLLYKRHKTTDPWSNIPMKGQESSLVGYLPHQPPAGKLQYKVVLLYQGEETSLTGEKPVIIRFKGAVPRWVLIPHVIIMFLAMLFSTRAGIEALRPKSNPRKLALWTTGLIFVGGFILGPLMQKFAFGDLWTGFPFGYDLTDNKTLIAFIGWIIALIAGRKGKPARGWVLAAAILLLIVYLIPHSVLGSELDYSEMDTPQAVSMAPSKSLILPVKLLSSG